MPVLAGVPFQHLLPNAPAQASSSVLDRVLSIAKESESRKPLFTAIRAD